MAADAHAFCPMPTPKVCAEYYESDTVFLGEVTDKGYVSEGPEFDWIRYTINVKDVYRGHPKTIEHVLTENASNRWNAVVGKTYLVFSRDGQTGSTCGPLDDPEYVLQAIQQIRALKDASQATIEGEVLRRGPNGSLGDAAEGVRLRVTGIGAEFEAITDQRGQFRVALPPGHYRLVTDYLRPTIYSSRNLDDIKLENGQCAQFQLIAK